MKRKLARFPSKGPEVLQRCRDWLKQSVLRCGQTRSPWVIARADHQAELCRQPYTARNLFPQYSNRVLVGTDLVPEPVYRFARIRLFESAVPIHAEAR